MQVVVIARDLDRAEALRRWIGSQVPGATIDVVRADLSLLADTTAAARQIVARNPRLALLVNNAGVFRARRQETAEGHEVVAAVNLLSPFVLIRELTPALQAGAPSRIVTVGSSTSDRASIDPDRLELQRGWTLLRAYGQSKLGVMMVTFEAARRLAGTGMLANVVHPGAVATSLVRTPGIIGLAWKMMAPFLRTEQQGAETPLHVALDASVLTGAYFKDRQPVTPNRRALDVDLVRRVWDATERLTDR